MAASVLRSGEFECLDCHSMFETIIGRNGDRRLRCEPCRLSRESRMNAENARLWRIKHAEFVRANDSERKKLKRATDPEFRARAREASRLWVQANPERAKATVDRWIAKNPDHVRDLKKRWKLENADRVREQNRLWYANNPDKAAAKTSRRHARKRQAPGHFTAEEFAHLCESRGHCCTYCGAQTKMTVDHVVPLSRGGSNHIENIAPACLSCNSRKRDRTVEEFMKMVAA